MTLYTSTIKNSDPSKPWLMMVHGVSQDSRIFSKQVDDFKAYFNLLLVDLPGHGQSASMDGPYGLLEFSENLKLAQDKAKITSSHFLGTHLGAGAGLLLAAHSPERINSLVLEAPVLPGHALPSVANTLTKVREAANSKGIETARKIWIEESEWFAVIRNNPTECRAQEQWDIIEHFSGKPWLDQNLASPIESIDELLTTLKIPALIFNGEYDLADFRTAANKISRLLKHSQQIIIPNGGGFPLWEYPTIVNEHVLNFYKNTVL
ncbi:MAG: alpha/beta fold hydrolase [Cellvibrionaceae bacterium]